MESLARRVDFYFINIQLGESNREQYPMDKYLRANRDMWNRLAPIHAASDFYENEAFLESQCTLDPIEVEEVGEVKGKSLLHLQCHFGQDTLSWARRGAKVTGVDFSGEAIKIAKALSHKINVPAKFVCADLNSLPRKLSGKFDFVFTSGGVLTWLPELDSWGKIIRRYLKPGGFFYIREFHPFAYTFDDREHITRPEICQPYFRTDQPLQFENSGSYADRTADHQSTSYEWPHSLAEIFGALIDAGLKIEFFHEFPFTSYQAFPFLKKDPNGRWRWPENPGWLPLMFSLKATLEPGRKA